MKLKFLTLILSSSSLDFIELR